ncbi:MAG: putative DNA binding domain-containing protein [Acidobacteria bacterium]|nr:putative DNA binding domain-containing protein [Acidobacteriota bacterium]
MARRRFRHSQRFDNPADRSHQEYLLDASHPVTSRTELLRLVRGGEDTYLELKVKLSNPERIAQGIVALANTNGGTIIFGVNDQLRVEGLSNPDEVQAELVRICREEIVPPIVPMIDSIAFDSGKRVVALDIDARRKPFRTRDGRFYMRFGAEKREVTRDELSRWLDEIRPFTYENIPLFTATESDIEEGLLWSFAQAFADINPLPGQFDTKELVRKDLLLAAGNGDEFFPTVAGLTLFGRTESVVSLFPRSTVKISRFSGENGNAQLVESRDVGGNLLHQFEAMMQFVERYCDLEKTAPRQRKADTNGQAVPRSKYHLYSVREAVANMLIHRDFALRDIGSRMNIYDNSIEFINARRTNGFVPPASRAIRFGITQRINPQIAAIFTRREYCPDVPQGGLPMILKQSERISRRRAEVYTSNDEFKLKIYGTA